MGIRFQWNPQKAAGNEAKHSVPFTEAASVFRDSLACIFDDEDHSSKEYREIIIGHSNRNRLLVVVFTERDDMIRIISARKADREEREAYEHFRR